MFKLFNRSKVVTYSARGEGGLLRWRVKSSNGEDISKVSEGYHHHSDRVKSIRLTFEACHDWLRANDPEYFQRITDKGFYTTPDIKEGY